MSIAASTFMLYTRRGAALSCSWKARKHAAKLHACGSTPNMTCDAACLGWASGTLHASREKTSRPQQEAGDDVI